MSEPRPDIERLVRRARRLIPRSHLALLEQIGVQELVVTAWPEQVLDLYRTLQEEPPSADAVEGAIAVWLEERRLVAFNGELLARLLIGLDPASQEAAVNAIAWHEYGHALSATRASRTQKRTGVALLELLPAGLRAPIDYPSSYRRMEVFDEVIANVYAFMISRAVQRKDYGRPEYLHADVFNAFLDVVPWPPSST